MIYPLYQEISYQNPVAVFALFANQNGSVFLDSAQLRPACARFSFIAVDPFLILTSKNDTMDPFAKLADELAQFTLARHQDLPPFQGGVAGFFGYDLCQHLEKFVSKQIDDIQFPDLALGFYDLVIAFDHELKKAWIFSSGFPLTKESERLERSQERLIWLEQKLQSVADNKEITKSISAITTNFTCEEYCEAVQKVQEYILAGDIFEANISQRFSAHLPEDYEPFALYCNLRAENPAPFAAYLNFQDTIIASASPERFLKLTYGQVETRPIKGTRPRGKTQEEDLKLAHELSSSIKDQAENVMIVDLLRNDLSRVCEDHSVQVPQLCGLESYATVHHLVSVVTGKLRQDLHAVDLLRATFPGGSITGAPKIRAMEIIAEIEPTQRGPYCGSVGYIGFNGDMDTSITIRTYTIKNQLLTFQAGGAITVDSNPLTEYEETLTKAQALRKALSL
ncbi:MAG: aminodeoxychorismate synthase component I [Gammaproteobacteria bacterium]